jgi:transposase
MLVELGLVEQRYKAVCEVLDGATVTDVAQRNGVSRQTVHTWLRRYANRGMAGLVDKSSTPEHRPAFGVPRSRPVARRVRPVRCGK